MFQDFLYRQTYKLILPSSLQHMKRLWPNFILYRRKDGSDLIYWKKEFLCQTNPIKSIQNTNSGLVFLIGSGPSVKNINLGKLKPFPLIAMNGSISLAESDGLSFIAYVITDPRFITDRFNLAKKALLSEVKCFFNARCYIEIAKKEPKLLKRSNLFYLEHLNEYYAQPKLSYQEFQKQFHDKSITYSEIPDLRLAYSHNIDLGVSSSTVMAPCLQIASYMGFSQIGIVGMDISNAQTEPRFYESKSNMKKSVIADRYEEVIEPFFKVVSTLLNDNFQVYNLSSISKLPSNIIPKCTVDDLIQ